MSTKRLIAYYDDPSYDYSEYWREREYENEADKIALRKLLQLVSTKELVVDIGAGFGRLTSIYAPLFKQCILVDPSKRLLREAQKLTKKCKNLTFKRAFAERLPFRDKSVDVILCIRTFHHLRSPQLAIKEFARLLKPGGSLILEFANKLHLKNCLKSILALDFSCFSQKPEDISQQKEEIPFLNYHPQHVKFLLQTNGFRIIKACSVSNFRHPLIKKLVPLPLLLSLESGVSLLSSHFSCLLGPSIFILAQKENK